MKLPLTIKPVESHRGIYLLQIHDAAGRVVAEIGEFGLERDRAEWEACARLFCAAPKMLTLLKALASSKIAHGCVDGKPVFASILTDHFQPAALALIAEAEGSAAAGSPQPST